MTNQATPSQLGQRAERRAFWIDALLFVLFFLLGTTWLLAPFVHGQRFDHHLYVISSYEGLGQPWAWAFRLGDASASLVLVLLVYRLKLWRQDRSIAGLLLAFAVLSALDAVFPLDCRLTDLNHCLRLSGLSTLAHHIESVLTPLVAGIMILLDYLRRRRRLSIAFLGLQIILGLMVFFQIISGQSAILLEYIYEVLILLWVLYLLEAYLPQPALPPVFSRVYRVVLAGWVAASGILAIVLAAAHLHLYGRGFALYFGESSTWLAQQGVFFGVLLLYLARQVYRGQRRAAYLLLAIFAFELFNYSLVGPHPVLACVYGITFILLFVARHSFSHNVVLNTLHRRLYDFSMVIGGVAAAVAIVAILLAGFGRLHYAARILDQGSDYVTHVYKKHDHRIVRNSRRVRQTAAILAFTTTGVSLWALFRPSGADLTNRGLEANRRRAKALLERFSNSSEDYFKLWPPDKDYYFARDDSGFIAYRLAGGTAFALADPIAPSRSQRGQLLAEFNDFCSAKGWAICFLPVDEGSKALYRSAFKLLAIGSSAVIDIQEFAESTKREKWWRWQANRAKRSDFSYSFSTPPHDKALFRELAAVSSEWLTRSKRREQGFAMGYFDEAYLSECRLHLVRTASGQVAAFTNELPIFGGSRATVDLLRYRLDQDGAMPFLLMSLIEQLSQEGNYKTFDLGFAPFAQLDSRAMQIIRALAGFRLAAAGLEQFKNKFRPEWTTNYIAYNGDILDLAALALRIEAAMKP